MHQWLHPGVPLESQTWRPRPITALDDHWAHVTTGRIPAYVEASIRHGLQWTVFEPNGEQLWSEVRRQVEDYLLTLWREGHLRGDTAQQAFSVTVDHSTMTQDDLDNGRLVVVVGMAPLRPAQFVVIRIGMWTADVDRDPDDD